VRLGYACQSNAHARAVAADAPDVPSVASCIGAAVSFDHGEPPVSDEDPRAPAAEQAALRRVATMVARGVAPEEVFAAVTKEVGRLIGVDYAGLNRYEADGTTMTHRFRLEQGRRPSPSWWHTADSRWEEHQYDRLRDGPCRPDRRLCRFLWAARSLSRRLRDRLRPRDAARRRGAPLGRDERLLKNRANRCRRTPARASPLLLSW
jgi:hypothetical protein